MKKIVLILSFILSTFTQASFTETEALSMFSDLLGQLKVGKTYVLTETGTITRNGTYLCDYNGKVKNTLQEINGDLYTISIRSISNFNDSCKQQIDYEDIEVISANNMAEDFFLFQDILANENGIDINIDTTKKEISYSVDSNQVFTVSYKGLNIFQYEAMITEGGESSGSDLSYSSGKPVYSEM